MVGDASLVASASPHGPIGFHATRCFLCEIGAFVHEHHLHAVHTVRLDGADLNCGRRLAHDHLTVGAWESAGLGLPTAILVSCAVYEFTETRPS